jgi:hypothetical protein
MRPRLIAYVIVEPNASSWLCSVRWACLRCFYFTLPCMEPRCDEQNLRTLGTGSPDEWAQICHLGRAHAEDRGGSSRAPLRRTSGPDASRLSSNSVSKAPTIVRRRPFTTSVITVSRMVRRPCPAHRWWRNVSQGKRAIAVQAQRSSLRVLTRRRCGHGERQQRWFRCSSRPEDH